METGQRSLWAPFCEYSDIFGLPGEGPHAARMGPFAAVDVIGTAAGAGLVAALWSSPRGFGARWLIAFVILILISVVFHWAFCVPTAITRAVGLA